MEAHETALNKAKVELMSKPSSAFFTTIVFSLKQRWDNSIPTAATNGKDLLINTEFFMGLTQPERVFLLVHEAMHVALDHITRKGDKEAFKWNCAADHAINLMLQERGYTIIKGALADKQYTGMSADEIYKLLPENEGQSQGDMVMEDLMEPETEEEREALGEHINDILIRASVQSRMQGDKPGTIPGSIQAHLDDLLDPKLPWNVILRRFMNSFSKNDYTFRRPNRRYFPRHYLPSMYSKNLSEIAVAIDTSASVSDFEFKYFITEVAAILRTMKPKGISVIHFDTSIKEVHKVRTVNELVNIKFHGRGGTDIHPLLEWNEENKPQLLLVFTDGEFGFNYGVSKPSNSILWMIHDNESFTSPFGTTINYEV